MENNYDVIVVGSGHAGCEAALICARKKLNTMLLTLNLDSIAFLACNPSIGGTAKGQLVSEIDALGGQMGKSADKNTIERRMLNSSKGVAVQSLRAQIDKVKYHTYMKKILEHQKYLTLKQGECSDILQKDGVIYGIKTAQGDTFLTKSVIICTGVYLNSKILIGEYTKQSGPNGFSNATLLTNSLLGLGFKIMRFKTGTPVRVHSNTIDYSNLEIQQGDDNIQNFSQSTKYVPKNLISCYLTHTNLNTHKLILDNLQLAPMYSGKIEGRGPRYCPSIEDKVVRFKDKERHQLFLEPEALSTKEVYVQGLSTSMPTFMQEKIVHSICGLEHASIMRDAYAIEYDCINPTQLYPTLSSKKYKGLYFAGQVNGTSGYEEAGAQGIIAGINASQYVRNQDQLILKRSDGYIGVLIDDLVTKGTSEPYRMMTSRAEYRLYLRQDNADIRLIDIGRKYGHIDNNTYNRYKLYQNNITEIFNILKYIAKPNGIFKILFKDIGESMPSNGITLKNAISRNNIDIFTIIDFIDKYNTQIDTPLLKLKLFSKKALLQVNTQIKYEGYLKRENEQIDLAKKEESILLPFNFDYNLVNGLRIEAKQKLLDIKPLSLGQASRISGVSPADIMVLTIYLKTNKKI